MVSQGNEQRSNVLAVAAVARGKCRTSASGHEPPGRELERNLVGLGLGSTDASAGTGVLDDDAFDRVAPDVVVPAKVGSRAEQTPESAVIECRECFGER
jgi:hypothetical protein